MEEEEQEQQEEQQEEEQQRQGPNSTKASLFDSTIFRLNSLLLLLLH